MNLNDNKFYQQWFKNSWSYVTGAILLSLLQIVTLSVIGEPLKITSIFIYWAGWVFSALGADVSSWKMFSSPEAQATLQSSFLTNPISVRNIGIIIGALLASLLASQFKIRKVKSYKQVIAAIIGGLLMGYGSKIAFGCNIGAFFSGVSSLSLSGWLFGLFMFFGAIIGSKLLIRFLL
ncbi:MAG TPA: YeeE/YedE family protein [Eubacteriaceae bacterium]|nr:YeeE/YedE family protein [Eubacteriaceae bacterium]